MRKKGRTQIARIEKIMENTQSVQILVLSRLRIAMISGKKLEYSKIRNN